jgi:hypothetical protein
LAFAKTVAPEITGSSPTRAKIAVHGAMAASQHLVTGPSP